MVMQLFLFWEKKEDDEENNPPLLNGKVNFISLSTVLCAAIISSKAIEEKIHIINQSHLHYSMYTA